MRFNQAITDLRNALGLKVSYGLRAFVIYFVILGGLSWFILDQAIERINIGMRQSAENIMVDSANVLAALLETQLGQSTALDTDLINQTMQRANAKTLLAKIYQIDKTSVSSRIYVTDDQGIVLFDSAGESVGKDFSEWNDVLLTLRGEYGARTSYLKPSFGRAVRQENTEVSKEMVVGAPIQLDGRIIGVLSLATPVASLEQHLAAETRYLQAMILKAVGIALFCGFLLSLLFSRSINKIANYADKMASGADVAAPNLLDQRLADLADSVANLRQQLDGKQYVEKYIHSLTHELKTPITGIQGAVELIQEGLPESEQARFIDNISNSNKRMARLVDRMLNLAQLESRNQIVEYTEFDLQPVLTKLIDERQTLSKQKELRMSLECDTKLRCRGDAVLLSQAIGNLLDNAIHFANVASNLTIDARIHEGKISLKVDNQGEQIPDYALPRIYERFFSLPSKVSADSTRKSTGLGLSFVREIMKLHRGQVTVKNTSRGVSATLIWPQ